MALQAIQAEAVATSQTYGGLQNVVADGTAASTVTKLRLYANEINVNYVLLPDLVLRQGL